MLAIGAVSIAVAAAAPTAVTSPADNVAASTATLNAIVSPNQQDTTYYFEYGTDTAYGTKTPNGGPISGNSDKSVSANVAGLQPSTTYHYRVVAANASGTVQGNDVTFTTAAPGTPPPAGNKPPSANTISIKASPNPITFGSTSVIAGRLSGPNNGGQSVTLQQNRYPFTGSFTTAATATTTSNGSYSFTVKPLANTRYRVTLKDRSAVVSSTVQLSVRVKVGFRLSDSTPRRGQLVRFSGTVVPAHNGKRALIQKRTATGGWRTIASATLVATTPAGGVQRSRYLKRLRIRTSATYRVVVKPRDGDHATGTSARRRATVH